MADEKKDAKSSAAIAEKKEEKDINRPDANPADPYQNHQNIDVKDLEVSVNYNDALQARKQTIMRENMDAKQAEIDKPGALTQEEANKLKQGLPPEKQAEVQSQVVDYTDKNIEKKMDRANKINVLLDELLADNTLGRNETRGQLRELRQRIQAIEVQMDLNRI